MIKAKVIKKIIQGPQITPKITRTYTTAHHQVAAATQLYIQWRISLVNYLSCFQTGSTV